MSKYLKNLISEDLARRLEGIDNAVLVNVVGLDANQTVDLRRTLREDQVQLIVVKNSLARRATEGTPLESAFRSADGPLAIAWSEGDVVSLAKLIVKLASDKQYEALETRGGVMDGAPLTSEEVQQISKWPTREEQLGILVGQILGPGARLAAQLRGPGGALVSQIKSKADEESA